MEERARAQVRTQERVEDPLRSDGDGHRHIAAGDPLAQAHEVGTQSGPFACEHLCGAAEARRNLVGHEQYAGVGARVAESADVCRVGDEHPRRALDDRFDHGRGQRRPRGAPM